MSQASSTERLVVGTPAGRQLRGGVLALLSLVFIGAALGGWAWFHVSPGQAPPGLYLDTRPVVKGYGYADDYPEATVLDQLSTTNVMNGVFTNAQGAQVRVFRADWSEQSGQRITIAHHTPDICWVSVGMRPLDLGQPRQIELQLGDQRLPFECRVFGSPDGARREFVVWCTLLGGQVLPETSRFTAAAGEGRQYTEQMTREKSARQFVEILRRRIPPLGYKQMVRFSAPCLDDWQTALEQLRDFGAHWIEVRAIEGRLK